MYAYVWSYGMKEEDYIPLLEYKVLDKYQDSIDLTSLLSNFAYVLPEVERIINSRA